MGASIKYGVVAVGAKESFTPIVSDKAAFVDLAQLQEYNLKHSNYANPCERYQTLLNGSAVIPPENPQAAKMGYWSNSISGTDGSFANDIVMMLESTNGNYICDGFTLTFDIYNNIYCNDLNIKWYQGGILKHQQDFEPTSAFYFCQLNEAGRSVVAAFDKIEITFHSLNMPHNRLKLLSIDYGYGTIFDEDELIKVSVLEEINPLSENLIMNVCDFEFESKADVEYNFQNKQPLSIYHNSRLVATQFTSKAKRLGKHRYKIETMDYVGIMDGIPFVGDIYLNKAAADLFAEIFAVAKVPYTVADDVVEVSQGARKLLSGYIPYCTCRQALQMVCFAMGAVADTSNSECVDIYKLPSVVTQTIPKGRIKQGQNFETSDKVTAVALTQYAYTVPDYDETETPDTSKGWVELYKEEHHSPKADIFVQFNQPMVVDSLRIARGEIIESGVNHARIRALGTGLCIMAGMPYTESTSIKTMEVGSDTLMASDVENIKEITGQTLVSAINADDILQLCFDFYTKANSVNMTIFEGKHIIRYNESNAVYNRVRYNQHITEAPTKLCDLISCDTEYLGTLQGHILKQKYNLDGNRLAKEVKVI